MHHHGAGLRRILTAEGLARKAQESLVSGLLGDSIGQIDLGRRERALLVYGEKLTRYPAAINARDIEALREVGLDDRAIHDACAIVAYFAFVNRIADGLGVEVEGPGPASVQPT